MTSRLVAAAALVAATAATALAQQTAAPSDTLTLARARRLAVAQSPALAGAAARADAAGAGRWEAWGAFVPSVRLSVGTERIGVLQRTATDPITGGIVALPDSLIQDRRSFGTSASLSLGWRVFDGGAGYLGVRRAGAAATSADRALDAARARAEAGATLAFLDALDADALLAVRRAEVERARALRDAASARYQVGAAPELDTLQARITLSDAELGLEDALLDADAARLALAEYIGPEERDAALVVANPIGDVAADAASLRVCAVARSPELASLEAAETAAARRASAATWSLLPTVDVGATWSRSEFGNTREALTFDPRNSQVYYGLTLSWAPLDRPGAWVAERKRADAARAEAEAGLRGRRATMVREAELALGHLERADRTRERIELNARLAARQREQAVERYRLGLSSLAEAMQAEGLARSAEREASIARSARLRALAELELATGTGMDDFDCATNPTDRPASR